MLLKNAIINNFRFKRYRWQSRTTEFKDPFSNLFGLYSDDSWL